MKSDQYSLNVRDTESLLHPTRLDNVLGGRSINL